MMLRGSEVLFAALLSRLWLGRLLNRWHLAGLSTCTVSRHGWCSVSYSQHCHSFVMDPNQAG